MSLLTDLTRWLKTRPVAWLVPHSRTDALVARMVAASLEQGHGAGTVLDALARDTTVWTPPGIQRLAWALESGIPLGEGVKSYPGALRPETRRAILLGEETGTTVEQLNLTASLLDRRPEERFHSRQMFAPYFVLVLIVTTQILAFISYFIAPKFKKIFDGFDAELPLVTRMCLDMTDLLADYAYLGGIALIGMLWVWRAGRTRESALWNLSRYGWWVPWHDPRRATPGLLRQTVIARDRSLPVSQLLAALPQTTTETWLRHAFGQISRQLESGTPMWDVLAAEGFLTATEAAVLRSAGDIGNERWVALGLADTIEQRIGFRKAIRLELVTPLITLVMGLIVGFIVVAYFNPVVKLLNDLS